MLWKFWMRKFSTIIIPTWFNINSQINYLKYYCHNFIYSKNFTENHEYLVDFHWILTWPRWLWSICSWHATFLFNKTWDCWWYEYQIKCIAHTETENNRKETKRNEKREWKKKIGKNVNCNDPQWCHFLSYFLLLCVYYV